MRPGFRRAVRRRGRGPVCKCPVKLPLIRIAALAVMWPCCENL
ncbi:hypothetical protein HMPREF0591_0697 [Mycobacterium parascrofulaceum ATCC BAA-614]|uniref:Uncharacterized protein n=1 Tax=Mycobacterium parascrofulaceum ATCC BAA-614 TaxID=525368 RepID=D5P3F3_9MYCO|nr:hypothetical protein HMPREF0591_0697 [Mycobacterium parascrofulaceum ATCC BAA-614]